MADRFERWMTLLHWPCTGAALFMCFRGQGPQFWWVFLFLLVPALRWAASPSFRQRGRDRLNRLWSTCQAYATGHGPTPWHAAFLLVVLPCALVFLANNYWDAGDNTPVMLAASSLAREGDWDVSEFVNLPGWEVLAGTDARLNGSLRRTSTGIYSAYPAGPVQFALPVAWLARAVGADLDKPQVHNRLQKWTAAWVAAFSLGLFFLIALQLASPAAAGMTTCLLALGSAFLSTISQGMWQHGGVIFWSLILLLVEFRRERAPLRCSLFLQAGAIAMMLACRLTAVALIVPFGCWVLLRAPGRAFALTAISIWAFAPWCLFHWGVYGQPLGPSTGMMQGRDWNWSLGPLAGVLVSPARGLFVYQPWTLLALAACLAVSRKPAPAEPCRLPAGWQGFCVAAILCQLAIVSGWRMWWGGWCWGSRLVSDVLPLWGLLCVLPVASLLERRRGRVVIGALVVCSVLLHIGPLYLRAGLWNAVPGDIDRQTGRLWSWSRPPFLYPLMHREAAQTPAAPAKRT